MAKICNGCKYWRCMNGAGTDYDSIKACHYCVDTGELRGCPADECDKKDTTPYTKKQVTVKKKRKAELWGL